MSGASHLAGQAAAIMIVCMVLWCIDRDFGINLALMLFLGGMICQFLKIIWMTPRPWFIDSRLIPVESAVAAATGWSFPSGHTMTAVTLYGGLLFRFKRVWIRILCVVVIVMVALSRLYLGVHMLSDVLTSAGIGMLVLWFIQMMQNRAKQRPIVYNRVLASVLVSLTTLMLLLLVLRTAQGEPRELLLDGMVTAGLALGFLAGWWPLRGRHFAVRTVLPIQLVKLGIGLFVIVLLNFLESDGYVANFITYSLLGFWAIAAYPLIIQRLTRKKVCEEEKERE